MLLSTYRLIDSLGEDGFDSALADLLDTAAEVHQLVIFSVPHNGTTRCLFSWHRATPGLLSKQIAHYVRGKFDRIDPALHLLRHIRGGHRRLTVLNPTEISNADYRRDFFEILGLGRKLSILTDGAHDGLYLNFYKHGCLTDFSDTEIENLYALARMVCKSIQTHSTLIGTRSSTAPRLEAVRATLAVQSEVLTGRELDVCARIILGYTTEAIALDLGIAKNSVATYRKRSYSKLGISSHYELFGLCMRAQASPLPCPIPG